MSVYGYLRISGAESRELSIEEQEEAIEQLAVELGLSVNHWRRDRNVSSAVPLRERFVGEKLLALLQNGDTLLLSSFAAGFGTSTDALETTEELKARGIDVYATDLKGNLTGELYPTLETILAALTDAEQVSRRTGVVRSKLASIQEGKYVGGKVPFGYRVDEDGMLVEIPEQQQALKRLKELRDNENLSYRAICEKLKEELGVEISHTAVRGLYLGLRKTE